VAASVPSERTTRRPPEQHHNDFPLWPLFVGLSLILLAILPPDTPSGDGASMLAVADGLATGPTFVVDCDYGVRGSGGECYSNFYPLISVLALPFVWLGRAAGSAAGVSPDYTGHLLAMIVPALATAGAATFAAAISRRLGASRGGTVATAMAVAFGTELLTYSRSFFAETLAAFCVALAVWGLTGPPGRRWTGFAGIALAILAKPQTALFGPAVGLALALHQRRIRPFLECCAASAAGSLVFFAYNWHRFGSPKNFGGDDRELAASDFAPAELVEAIGLLTISPGRGVIWFSPVAALGLVLLWRRRRELVPFVCLLACVGLFVLYIGNPGSGFNWGSRYLVAMLPLMCVGLGALRGNLARVAVALAVVGFVVQIPNVVGYYHRYHREQADNGVPPSEYHWSVRKSQLVGVWPATVRQIEAAADRDVNELVDAGREPRGDTEDQVLLNIVGLWWWGLPAAGIPWAAGLLVCLGMIAVGAIMLARLANWLGRPKRGSPARRYFRRRAFARSG
jgi:hypothetical protein